MDVFETVAILLTLAAVLSYVNHRWWKMPPTIALMLGSLVGSLVLVGVGHCLFNSVTIFRKQPGAWSKA